MSVWIVNEHQQMEYAGGKEAWEQTCSIATDCANFVLDDEEELVADTERCCYNCRYRRWTRESFACLKQSPGK